MSDDDKLIDRARETIRKQDLELRRYQSTIKKLEKVVAKFQAGAESDRKARDLWYNKYVEQHDINTKLKEILTEAKRKRDYYLRLYQASKLESDKTESDNVQNDSD
jgi:hypothetical protein